MLHKGKKLLSWLMAISMVLSLIPAGALAVETEEGTEAGSSVTVEAPRSLEALTVTAQPVADTGGKAITITTANLFPFNKSGSYRRVGLYFTVEGLPEGGSWYADVTVGSNTERSCYIYDQNGARYFEYYIDTPQAGVQSVTVKISDSQKTTYYKTVTLDIWLVDYADFAPSLDEMNSQQIFHTDANRLSCRTFMTDDMANVLDMKSLSAKLVKAGEPADSDDVYAATSSADNNSSYSDVWYDVRYKSIFPYASDSDMPRCSGAAKNFTLYQAKPLDVGEYDLLVYDSGSSEPIRFSKIVRVTDKPLVSVGNYPYVNQVGNVAGSTTVYGTLKISGAGPEQFSLQLYDGETLLGTSNQWAVENAYGPDGYVNYVYAIPLTSPLASKSYELRVATDLDDYEAADGNSSLYPGSNPRAHDFYFSNHYYADLVGRMAMPKSANGQDWLKIQYKFELYYNNQLLATEYAYPSEDGLFDVEFHTADGEVYPLMPDQWYNVRIYYFNEDAYNPDYQWQSISNFSVGSYGVDPNIPTEVNVEASQEETVSLAEGGEASGEETAPPEEGGEPTEPTEPAEPKNPVVYANRAYFRNGAVNANFELYESSLCRQLSSDLNAFSFALRSVAAPEVTAFTLPAAAAIKQYNNNSETYFTVKAVVPESVPNGYYYADLYYNGELLVNPYTQEHILDTYKPIRPNFWGDNPSVSWSTNVFNTLEFRCGYRAFDFGSASNLEVQFFAWDNLSLRPDFSMKWPVSENDVRCDITEAQTAEVDLSKQYRSVIYRDGKAINDNTNYYYILPETLSETKELCSVSLEQAENGTLELLPTVPTVDGKIRQFSEVYVKATPIAGYQLKPGSVKVDGVSVDGRGFLVTGDCIVTAEFEPIPVKTYAINLPSYVSNGTLELSTMRAAEGEKVYVTPLPDAGYKVSSLQYYPKNGGDWKKLERDEDGRYYFIMPAEAVSISVSFRQPSKNTLSVYTNYSGSCSYTITSGEDSATNSSLSVMENNEVTLSITVNKGYILSSVSYYDYDIGETVTLYPEEDGLYHFIMPAQSMSVNVSFTRLSKYTVKCERTPSWGGSFTITYGTETVTNGNMSVMEGDEFTVEPSPNTGYITSSVTYADSSTGESIEIKPDEDGLYHFTMPAHYLTIYIRFEQRIEHWINGINYDAASGMTLTFPSTAYTGDKVTVTPSGINDSHYLSELYYDDSYGNRTTIQKDQNGEYSFIMPGCDITIGVVAPEKPRVESYGDYMGSAFAEKPYYLPGDLVNVQVVPNAGYTLTGLSYYSYQEMQSFPISMGADGRYSFVMPSSRVQLNAVFVRQITQAPGGEVYDYATLTAALGGEDNVEMVYAVADTGSVTGDTATADKVLGLSVKYETSLQNPIRVTGGDMTIYLQQRLNALNGSAFIIEDGNWKMGGYGSINGSVAPAIEVKGGNVELFGKLNVFTCPAITEGETGASDISKTESLDAVVITGGNVLIKSGEFFGGEAVITGNGVTVSGSGSLRVTGGMFRSSQQGSALLVGNTTGTVSLAGGEFWAEQSSDGVSGYSIRLPEGKKLKDYVTEENISVYLNWKLASEEELNASAFTGHVRFGKAYAIAVDPALAHVRFQIPSRELADNYVSMVARPEDGYRVTKLWYTTETDPYPVYLGLEGGFIMPAADIILHAEVEEVEETVLIEKSVFSAYQDYIWASFTNSTNQQLNPLWQTNGWKFLRAALKDENGNTVAVRETPDLYSLQLQNLDLPVGRYKLYLAAGTEYSTLPLGWQWITLADAVPYGGGVSRALTTHTTSFSAYIRLETSPAALPDDLTLQLIPNNDGEVVSSSEVVTSSDYMIRYYTKAGATAGSTADNGENGYVQNCELYFDFALPTGLAAEQYIMELKSANMTFIPSGDPSYVDVADGILFLDGILDPDTMIWTAKVEGLNAGSYQTYYQTWSNENQTYIYYYYTLNVDDAGNASVYIPVWPVEGNDISLTHNADASAPDFSFAIWNYSEAGSTNEWYHFKLDNTYSYDNWMVWSEGNITLTGRLDGAVGEGRYEIIDQQTWNMIGSGEIADLSAFSISLSGMNIGPQQRYMISVYRDTQQIGNASFQLISRPAMCLMYGEGLNGTFFQTLNLTQEQLQTLKLGYQSSEGKTELPFTILQDGVVEVDTSRLSAGRYTIWASCEMVDECSSEVFREPLYMGNDPVLYLYNESAPDVWVKPLTPETDENGVTTATVTYIGTPGGDVTMKAYRQVSSSNQEYKYFEKTPFFTKNIGSGDYTISSETLGYTGGLLFVFTLPDGTCIGQQALRFGEPASYTVTFVDWNGSVLSTQEVEVGGSAVPPKDPVREGYTFAGWKGSYIDVTQNTTVTATYKRSSFNVTFVDWNGDVLDKQTVKVGESAAAPATNPVREGYEFTGWNGSFENVQRDTVVYAAYKKTTATVRFHLSGGEGNIEEQTVVIGQYLTAPAEPSREGYEFIGWSTIPNSQPWDNGFWNFEEDTVTNDMMLYACWTAAMYRITADESAVEYFSIPDAAAEGETVYMKYIDRLPDGKQLNQLILTREDGIREYINIEPYYCYFTMPGQPVTISAVLTDASSSLTVTFGDGDDDTQCAISLYGMGNYWYYGKSPAVFNNIPDGTYELHVSHGGYWNSKTIKVSGETSITLEIPKLYSISGTVENLTGTSCWIYASGENGYSSVELDEKGQFTLSGLASGEYTLTLYDANAWLPVESGDTVTINGADVTDHTVTVKTAADLQVTLKTAEQNPAFRAYVDVYDSNGLYCGSATASGADGTTLLLTSLITEPGEYRIELDALYGVNYVGIPFECADVVVDVTEADITSGMVSAELVYSYPSRGTLDSLSGSSNLVALDRSEAYPGEVVTLNIRYKNNGTKPLNVSFTPVLPDGVEFYDVGAQTSYTEAVAVGKSGSISIPVKLTNDATGVLKIPVNATVGDETAEFGAAVLSVSELTISAPVQVEKGMEFVVSGEAASDSLVAIKNADTGLLLATVKTSGRFYSAKLKLAETTSLIAQTGDFRSESVRVEVVEDPLTVKVVKHNGDEASYNRKLDAFSFWQYVNIDLMGYELQLNVEFSRSDIAKVLFHFCDQDFEATGANGVWTSEFTNWGGSGLKPITADVTMKDGSTLTLLIAYVNLLIDPSGIITDENGDPLEGVTVTCQVLEDGVWVRWDAESYVQSNPIVTGADGKYGWMVPEGTYRILATKDGYEDYDSLKDSAFIKGDGSSSIIIPPPRTDVDITMKAKTMEIYPTASEEGYVTVQSSTAKVGKTVTVIATAEEGYVVSGIAVQTMSGESIEVNMTGNTAEFIMPASAVKVFGQYTSQAMPTVEIAAASGNEVKVSVKSLKEEAELVVALYEGNKMIGVTTYKMTGEGDQQIAIGNATQVRAFLLRELTREPLGAKTVWSR